MKEQYRLVFTLCVTALFFAGVSFGAIKLANYTTYVNETNEKGTNLTKIEYEDAVVPVETAVPGDTVVAPEETTIEPANPATTADTIPGFGIMATIMFVLFAIYLSHKGR